MHREMNTVSEIIDKLKEQHYIHNLSIKGDKILSDDEGLEFEPDDLIIECTCRYEGDSDPSDSAIVYAITAKNGMKGVLVDSYGAYADPDLAKIIGDIPLREEHEMHDNKEQNSK